VAGSILCLHIVSGTVVFNHENAGAAAATDRLSLPNLTSWNFPNGGACFVYDGTAARWKLTSTATISFPILQVLGALSGTSSIVASATTTAQTVDLSTINATNTGTFNTTAAARASYAVNASNTAARSTGGNDLTNYGIYATASGGQVNYAGWFQGSVVVSNVLTVNGLTNLGDGTTDTVSVIGRLVTNYTAVAETVSRRGIDALMTGTFDTTGAARSSFAVYADNTSTISAGANDLTNYGIYATASGAGAVNWAGWFQGDFAATGNMTLGTTTSNVITVAGDVIINDILQALGNVTFGDAVTDLVSINGDLTVTDAATFNGNSTFGNADTDTVEMNSAITYTSVMKGIQDKTPAPTFGSCGTSPSSTAGGNHAMTITLGSGTAVTCAVTFADVFTVSPTCVLSSRTGSRQDVYLSAVGTSGFTLSNVAGANMASAVVDVICVGH
jgi:hypothetical protein